MSHHIQLPCFAETITSSGTLFPNISGGKPQKKPEMNSVRHPQRPVRTQKKRNKPMSRVAPSEYPQWEFKHRMKGNQETQKSVLSRSPGGTLKDLTAALWQTANEEGSCRRLIVANENIQWRCILRAMGGGSAEKVLPSMELESRGMRLLASKDYAGAHVCFSRIIRQHPNSKTAHCRRAICDWHLLLFDECIEDARRGIDTDKDMLSLLCRSLVVRERYRDAWRWYDYGLKELAPSADDPHNVKWTAECTALPVLQKFRSCIEEKKWKEALCSSDAARPLIDDTPLILLEARALLYVSPTAARTLLMEYVPTIPRPTSLRTDVSLEEQAVWRSVNEHYVQASVVLAQANVYCGSKYLEFAAALVQTCLTLSPGFGPALVLGYYLVSLEEVLVRVADLFGKKRYVDAIPHINEGLGLDKSNRLMCAHLYCMRAEVHSHCGRYNNAVDDCTSAIDMDPSCAKAYACRAEAHYQLGCRAEAALDRLTAVKFDPELSHILRGDEEQSLPKMEANGSSQPRNGQKRCIPRWYDAFLRKDDFATDPFEKAEKENSTPVVRTMNLMTLYDALELPFGATIDDVRSQYKKLTLKYHPDRVIGESPGMQEAALEKFKRVSRAHEVLSNPEEKLLYDVSLGMTFSAAT
ncbi:TPR-repeat-containing chaperone protein DNAJ,putative [Trypanosoma brucei gambiense DAL972]|uniref:TPR-repeat-containing chaperone protein DNAJ,putative n=1 Tax=Trypanosoma brucei gambiense (strain MHOM/CI/86/DAL972) TaxID=679716 RepID=C9ZLT8_TRYB9|nr:TPR-repeat-containing chaperone protein DNAJ,putative [Trypanosoma brucei gambiense DAL972]CBH10363.1 TPR-repeat-containing chaperone protein DNAJ,putative [Trypanosoma brucei gambiense DAL972]|eukprot:XP_011772653.1 TPR-repeat-containing chaperone protein DNAJ,putative [Trypanosoma brucei gambiense DAL972]